MLRGLVERDIIDQTERRSETSPVNKVDPSTEGKVAEKTKEAQKSELEAAEDEIAGAGIDGCSVLQL